MNDSSAPVPGSQANPPLRRARVVVAEDQDEMRALLCLVLRSEGFEVHEAGSAPQLVDVLVGALSQLRPWSPDLIVTDLRMPGGSGLEVLEQIRRYDWRMPVVLITAFADATIHAEARRLGAACVLDKPFEFEEFRARVLSLTPPFRE